MTSRPLDQAAYDTGAQAIGFELTLALFGGPAPERACARTAPGAQRAADMARGAIAEATATLACIIGSKATASFTLHVLLEIVRQEGEGAAVVAVEKEGRP